LNHRSPAFGKQATAGEDRRNADGSICTAGRPRLFTVASTTASLVHGQDWPLLIWNLMVGLGQNDQGGKDRGGVKSRRPVHHLPASCADWLVAASLARIIVGEHAIAMRECATRARRERRKGERNLPDWAVAEVLDVIMGRRVQASGPVRRNERARQLDTGAHVGHAGYQPRSALDRARPAWHDGEGDPS
jgi:hypothetical protein